MLKIVSAPRASREGRQSSGRYGETVQFRSGALTIIGRDNMVSASKRRRKSLPPNYYRGTAHLTGRYYVLLAREKKTGKIYGYIDASLFSMGWSEDSANLWSSPPTHYAPGGKINGKRVKHKPGFDVFIARVNSKKCPIIIHFNENCQRRGKGNRRFTVKEDRRYDGNSQQPQG